MIDRWGSEVKARDFCERWMSDGMRVVDSRGGICTVMIDMTECASIMNHFQAQGESITYAPVFVCAAAKALSRHPELQILVSGNKKQLGGRIDICLSIAGKTALTPVVLVEDADHKSAREISTELRFKVPTARSEADLLMQRLQKWGWLIPFGFLRRSVLRNLLNRTWYRRALSGLFQVTILPDLDFFAAELFNTAGVLAVGGVAYRPAIREREVSARLTAPFTCTVDHKQWNAGNARTFLNELKIVLEQETATLFGTESVAAKAASA